MSYYSSQAFATMHVHSLFLHLPKENHMTPQSTMKLQSIMLRYYFDKTLMHEVFITSNKPIQSFLFFIVLNK